MLFATVLKSCSEKPPTQVDIVKKNVKEYIKEKMNDPSSYEYVKLELKDSITFNDNIDFRKIYIRKNMEYDLSSLERQDRYKNEIPSFYDQKNAEELNANINKNQNILSKIDYIATVLGD